MSDGQLSPPNGGLTPSHSGIDMTPSELLQQMVSASVQSALTSAMSSVNETITRSVSLALSQTPHAETATSSAPVPLAQTSGPIRPGKASRKRHHLASNDHPPKPMPVGGGVNVPMTPVPSGETAQLGNRPPSDGDDMTGGPSKSSRRNKPDSFEDVSDSESDVWSAYGGKDSDSEEDMDEILDHATPQDSATVSTKEAILDSRGIPFFTPDAIKHPRSGEWAPSPQVAKYIEAWIRKSLDRGNRNKLRAECPRPSLSDNVAKTPELDPMMVRYLVKTGKNPKKGIDKSFKAVQDRLLDILGPLTKLLDMAEQSVASGAPVPAEVMREWALRAICLLGNANTAASAERRRSILLRLDPQLTHLATDEPGPSADGLLFGESFLKNINKFVGLFSGLDKAQASLKKVGSGKVFAKAGRGRGRPSSRGSGYRPYHRGSGQSTPERPYYPPAPTQPPNPFFPPRGRPWRSRGMARGYPRARGAGY